MSRIASPIKFDFVIIGQQPWDTEIGSNCKNIALELSKLDRVLYVNSPLDRITLLKGRSDEKIIKRSDVIDGKMDGLIKIQDNLWNYYPDCIVESINWIPFTSIFNLFNKINNRKFASSIQKALEQLGFNNFVLFNDNEMFKGFYLQDYLKPSIGIYYSRDFMLGVDYWKRHGEVLEPQLIAKSDICFANSEYLAEYCRNYNIHSFNVGQGCDIDSFKDLIPSIIPELSHVSGPLIGYVGSLNSGRLDLTILEHIAVSKPAYTIVLVGPEDDVFKSSILHRLDNVIFLGQKDPETLPNFINAFDVCINPQLVNLITIGNYPRKIDEYLALGKPVIATLTRTMEAFSSHVYLAKTKEDYVKFIEQAISEDNEEKKTARKEFAYGHTWENSVQQMKVEIFSKDYTPNR